MKKLISIMLALILVVSMATVAFAATIDGDQDLTEYLNKAPVVSKTYEVDSGKSPAEVFTFTFKGDTYTNGDGKTVEGADIPAIEDVTISFDEIVGGTDISVDLTENALIDVDDYDLGVYTYVVEETAGSTAGVNYDSQSLYLVLTILRDEDSGKNYVAAMHYSDAAGAKQAGFSNSYSAGKLSITKNITGNMANMDKDFTFTVTFNAPANTVFVHNTQIVDDGARTYTVVSETDTSATYSFTLGNADTATFSNLPVGTTYEISEDAENYIQSSVSGETKTNVEGKVVVSGTIEKANEEDAASYTNTLTSNVDTGISLDSIPFVLMLVVCAGAAVLFVIKRRSVEF